MSEHAENIRAIIRRSIESMTKVLRTYHQMFSDQERRFTKMPQTETVSALYREVRAARRATEAALRELERLGSSPGEEPGGQAGLRVV